VGDKACLIKVSWNEILPGRIVEWGPSTQQHFFTVAIVSSHPVAPSIIFFSSATWRLGLVTQSNLTAGLETTVTTAQQR